MKARLSENKKYRLNSRASPNAGIFLNINLIKKFNKNPNLKTNDKKLNYNILLIQTSNNYLI